MQIVINDENRELTYELIFDRKKIIKLIDEIVKKCAYRKNGRYFVDARTVNEAERKIINNMFWKDIKTYENFSDIKMEDVEDKYDYWRPGDPRPYSFEAEAIVVPDLVICLVNVLNGKNIDYNWFVKREELYKKDVAMKKIQLLDLEINKISNFDWNKKMQMLEEFASIVKCFRNIPNFDNDILSNFYDKAESCIKLELIQEKIKKKIKQ